MLNKIRKINSGLTPKPTRAFGGPACAGIEFDTATNALVVAPTNPPTDATRVAIPGTFTVHAHLQGAAPATAANYGAFWVAPFACEVVSVRARHGTASSSGTVMVNKVPSGTAVASGTNVLASTISTAGTANTPVSGSLHATLANRQLTAGQALGLVQSGTLTSSADLSVTVELKRLP